ncbi:EXS-domain-containing protein [Sistotremastrum suecicum HHB10207 ss-3]|uniref:EXS-domain-containing protein n=1 Tax=Sistotremastrum suecicum HHB10207 ss-3 TaxID=1314776 RepID=A0A166H896_9AGAM|nr:EXS-domain-containing protein [Sistotremastrum suecicum HHB10207 ss-3]
MDIDSPLDNRPVSAFSSVIPLPYRVIVLAGCGLLCWATNIHALQLLGIDLGRVLNVQGSSHLALPLTPNHSPRSTPEHNTLHHAPIYSLFLAFVAFAGANWLIFRALTHGDLLLIDRMRFIPASCLVIIILAVISPLNILHKRERRLFLHSLKRCILAPLDQPVFFSDVILADVLTSYAKVFGDLWVSSAVLLRGGSLVRMPAPAGFSEWMIPYMMSIPYAIRFRQCIVDYYATGRVSSKQLWNAAKYATAFPVIFLSAAQRIASVEPVLQPGEEVDELVWFPEHPLFRLWLLCVVINSLFSFWWDITNDWGLTTLHRSSWIAVIEHPAPSHNSHSRTPSRNGSSQPERSHNIVHEPRSSTSTFPTSHPWGLRTPLVLFQDPVVYYLAILLNLLLRFIWSLKLSSHLHNVAELESGIFLMEALELFRRWIWVFFRVEWEYIKQESGPQKASPLHLPVEELELDMRESS